MPALFLTLLPALLAGVISFAVGGLVRRVALARDIVVAPRPDRWHQTPTPTYGGIGVLLGTVGGRGDRRRATAAG